MGDTITGKALWAGRFRKSLDKKAKKFSSSMKSDIRLADYDIVGSIAHVAMLGRQGIIELDEAIIIGDALQEIRTEIATGILLLPLDKEDIHLAIEEILTERIGELGGKLHTARSRNDQIALDQRLFLRDTISNITNKLHDLQKSIVITAQQNKEVVMPGYTHLQRAQPILLSHHLLAYVSMFERDAERLTDCYKRVNHSPLGAAAFAGTSFPIDRDTVASGLDLSGIIYNSIDAVSDRDYLLELASDCSIIMIHLSRMAEELILWSTAEFGFLEMDDSISTGSSIMPQKKNPDIAELIRGKSGRVFGSLINLLTIMKGLPLAYNRDMQCDKEPMFEMTDTTIDCLSMMKLIVDNITFKKEHIRNSLNAGFLSATEIADYLVRKGLTFREAHRISGELVDYCEQHTLLFIDLTLSTLLQFSPSFSEDIFDVLDPERSISLKMSKGSTSLASVNEQLQYWNNKYQ